MKFDDIKIQKVSRKDFEEAGKTWPLKVPEGLIMVRSRDNAICFNDSSWDRQTYALNDVAQSIGFMSIQPIWIIDPKSLLTGRPYYKSLSDLIQVGLDLLGYKEDSK